MTTFSVLQRVKECPASQALPHIESTGSAAQLGTHKHKFVEEVRDLAILNGIDKWEARDTILKQGYEDCKDIDLNGIPMGPNSASEVKFALNIETGEARCLLEPGHRNYPDLGPEWIYGTADGIDENDGYRIVCELKTGESFIPHPSENLQIRVLAYCVAVLWPGKPVKGVLNIRSASKSMNIEYVYRPEDHAETLRGLRDMRTHIEEAKRLVESGKEPKVREGEHCRYCPAITSCPAKIKLASSLANIAMGTLTTERLREVYYQYRAARDVLDHVEKRLNEIARANPILLDDGKQYGLTTENAETVDAEALLKLYPEASACVEQKVTKASLERWAKEHWRDRSRAFFASLRRAEIIKSKPIEKLKVHKKAG